MRLRDRFLEWLFSFLFRILAFACLAVILVGGYIILNLLGWINPAYRINL